MTWPQDPRELMAMAPRLLSFYADCLKSDGRPETAKEAREYGALVGALAADTLTDEKIDAIAAAMPGGLDGFLKGWGWRQFARAVIVAAPPAPAAVEVPECLTCSDHGAVGNILTAEPCPDCTPAPAAMSVLTRQEIINRFDFLEGAVTESTYLRIVEAAATIQRAALAAAPPAPTGVAVPADDCCNSWFMSLSEGRQAVLRDDKWMLAHAAFDAGRAALAAAPAQAVAVPAVPNAQMLAMAKGYGLSERGLRGIYAAFLAAAPAQEHATQLAGQGQAAREALAFIATAEPDAHAQQDVAHMLGWADTMRRTARNALAAAPVQAQEDARHTPGGCGACGAPAKFKAVHSGRYFCQSCGASSVGTVAQIDAARAAQGGAA